MDYVEQAGIRIAKPLYDFVNSEALPGTSIEQTPSGPDLPALLKDLAPRCKALLDKRDSHPAANRHLAQSQQGQAGRYRGLPRFPARHRLPGGRTRLGRRQHVQGRSRDRHPRRPAAGRAGDQCPICAERGERPLGQPVRRALRHRRDPRGRRRDPRARLQPGPWRQGRRQGPRNPRRRGAARQRQPCRRHRVRRDATARCRSA